MPQCVPRARALAASALAAGALLTGCVSGGASVDRLGTVPDDVAADLVVTLQQARLDYADRVVEIEVVNSSDTDLVLLGGELESDSFGPSTETEARPFRAETLAVGGRRGVYVELGEATCPTDPAEDAVAGSGTRAAVTVALGSRADHGAPTTVEVPISDPGGHLARNFARDCAAAAVASGVTLTQTDAVRTERRRDGTVAVITLLAEPVDDGPDVRITRIDGSTLIDPADGAAWTGRALEGQDDGVLELALVPARCDHHAVSEDKRGTFLPVHAEVNGAAQRVVYVPMPDDAKRDLFEYIADHCGWPEG
ncbi:hypothetical protein [Myceligenerans xiligouense]|uniref:Uncharacterized protein n=1 Tax=Myceligenerans xiligouense TaxID=253184 RepID=A0A3N4ZD03_9MICO|nr:hypothetical protein [Myceligenerans xiligouense]RPF23352.1 hypothetical protein EDD34_4037 [Myceligenerans xiligouense]